jgi:uncharacterized protein YdeI (BOF family)
MRKALMVIAAAIWMAAPAFAADKTWNGTISDSNCGAKHAAGEEHGAKMSKSDCVKACVGEHDAKYVFVSGDKTYKIDNQDFAGLKAHAGHNVALSGEMKGDSITVSKIEMPSKAATDKK